MFLRELILLGFLINTLVAIFLFFVSSSEKFTKKVMKIIVNILDKVNLVKDKKVTKDKWKKRLEEFHENTKDLLKNKKRFALGIFLNLLSLTCFYIIPLFVVYSFHDFLLV